MDIADTLKELNVKFYSIKLYQVGGCVRDELLGVKSKDIDYSVVIESRNKGEVIDITKGLEFLELYLVNNGYTIFLKTPETFTFRAKNNKTGEIADFVLARHEIGMTNQVENPKLFSVH